MIDPDFITSSDVSAGDDATAAQYNALRDDIIKARLPVMFTVAKSTGEGSIGVSTVYTDDFEYWAYLTAWNTFKVKDMRSGGDYETRTITSDWADGDDIFGIAKIGSYLYVGIRDSGANENRVYRFDPQDLASGGAQMTATIGDGTTYVDSMISDGTYLWFNNDAGNEASVRHKWAKFSISGTTLTDESTTITCGATDGNFETALMDSAGNFYGLNNSGDKLVRRHNSSGTLQATTSVAFPSMYCPMSIEGVPYFCYIDAGNTLLTYTKLPLLP